MNYIIHWTEWHFIGDPICDLIFGAIIARIHNGEEIQLLVMVSECNAFSYYLVGDEDFQYLNRKYDLENDLNGVNALVKFCLYLSEGKDDWSFYEEEVAKARHKK